MSVGRIVRPQIATRSDIQAAHERFDNRGNSQLGQLVQEIADGDDSGTIEDVDRLRDLASEAPVIRLVNLLIVRARREPRASDIHIEPFENRLHGALPHRRRAARGGDTAALACAPPSSRASRSWRA